MFFAVSSLITTRRRHEFLKYFPDFFLSRSIFPTANRSTTKEMAPARMDSPSSVLFLAISDKSISELGSFTSDEDDDDEFCS